MLFLSILLHLFLRSVLMLLVVFLSIYQLGTIQPIATTTIIIPAQNDKLLIPSTSAAVGSSGILRSTFFELALSIYPCKCLIWVRLPHALNYLDACWCVVIVAAHAPSPKDTPTMTIPLIKSSFGFVIIVSYSSYYYVSHLEYLEMLLLIFSN